MVSSSKKKRGKQRKAAKAQAVATNSVPTVDENTETAGVDVLENISEHILQDLLIQTVQRKVQSGHETGTLALLSSMKSLSKSTPKCVIMTIVPDVLNFLKRCEEETFDQVMASVGGDLVTPTTWINLLFCVVTSDSSYALQIIENIGPLVRCMCNDTERLFFKSNARWRQGISTFIGLIHNIIMSNPNGNNHIVQVLLEQHKGLLTSIIQWGYWSEQCRPDIIQVLDGNNCAHIVDMSRNCTNQLLRDAFQMKDGNGELTKEGTSLLTTIGTTPIVSKIYDPDCMVSYTSGVIRQAKIGKAEHFCLLPSAVDCVDKGVMTDMIDLGLNFIVEYNRALDVAHISFRMILESSDMKTNCPSDSRIATAIRAGLIEMCLSFIERFGDHSDFGTDKASMFYNIIHIFSNMYVVSLHQKTAKAISSKRRSIEDKLVHMEQNNNNITNITNNPKCKKLLDVVKSILDLNGSYCCRCNKSLSKTEVKQCNRCHRMSYCSKACQKEDWFNGHKLACCKSYTVETAGQFQGRCWPHTVPENERAASKLKELEVNMNMIQLKLFLDNSETILSQAETLEVPLYDCVAVFDLKCCPPVITVKRYTDAYSTPSRRKGFEESRSKDNITCLYFSSIYNGEILKNGRVPNLRILRMFPHEWLTNSKKGLVALTKSPDDWSQLVH